MRITYDAGVDAAYIYLTERRGDLETVVHDYVVMLDFVEGDRLAGVEVLDASMRLDLAYLRPYIDKLDGPVFRWFHLTWELKNLLKEEFPIEATETHDKVWVKEVSRNTVKVRFDGTGEIREVGRKELEDLDITPAKAIRKLGILHTLYEMGRPPWPAKPYTFKVERDLSELTPNQ